MSKMDAYIKGYLKKEADQAGTRPGYFSRATWRELLRGLMGRGDQLSATPTGIISRRNRRVEKLSR